MVVIPCTNNDVQVHGTTLKKPMEGPIKGKQSKQSNQGSQIGFPIGGAQSSSFRRLDR